ncbi:hypothetical protein [Streptomyces sp. MST-110588]|uniref:hypothetical protein n=1 Tax=Streptomyces sp. MST-110588 TaxID=2833628 RepID=UPI001F5E1469|nr:hypothetical protein [Streptomyces sp. MST-110588]
MTNDVPRGPAPWLRLLRGISPARRGFVLAWWGFTVTFGGLRLLTWLVHIDAAGVGDVRAGGVHLHHYVWGILLLIAVAAAGLVKHSPRWRAWMGLAFGVGLALVVDEAALLISLEDVYWDSEGGISIALAISLIGVVGGVLAITRRGTGRSSKSEEPKSEERKSEESKSEEEER